MDKLNFETPDMVLQNIEKIAELFPSAVTEMRDENGKLKKGINFETLKQLLSPDVVDGGERYEFTWVGKKAAMAEVARPITKTLRPVKEDSRDWETTENLYIEGDNLEVLKILQESYLGKVKMIYVDPPYNTGNDFIYADNFMITQKDNNEKIEMHDEFENKLFRNTEVNGRFHSDWCCMIYSRLSVARNLLTDDGVIFISIDEKECANLRQICNEIFGDSNFLSNIVWQSRTSISNDYEISLNHNHTLIYSKNREKLVFGGDKLNVDEYHNYDNDSRGPWKLVPLDANHAGGNTIFPIENPKTGVKYYPPNGRIWCYNQQTILKLLSEGRIKFGINDDSSPKRKLFLNERIAKGDKKTPSSLLLDAGTTKHGTNEIMDLFKIKKIFDYPKPTSLINRLIQYGAPKDGIILDFFSGSATTAHAVMQLNAEDGGHRKFIMVQLPEPCGEKTEAYKVGYKNICEIGKERIRRAGDKIKSEHPDADLDIGFRVFRVDESNMKDVYYHPEEVQQQDLFEQVSNIKEDRTDMDLLYACLLDWGVEIHLPHTQEIVEGCTVHDVDGGALMACFDEKVPVAVVEHMAQKQPLRVVFRDSAFASDAEKINVSEIFKNLSPDTKVKVL